MALLIASTSVIFVIHDYTIIIVKHGIVLSKLEAFFMESNFDLQVTLYLVNNPNMHHCVKPKVDKLIYLEMEETGVSAAGNKHLIKIHRIFPDIHFLFIQCCLLLE